MYGGRCHCGSVRWSVDDLPERAIACNCSICRRLGALWGFSTRAAVQLTVESPVIRYRWGDGLIDFCSCSRCGTTTHYESTDPAPDARLAVNLNTLDDRNALTAIQVRHFDGAESWTFTD